MRITLFDDSIPFDGYTPGTQPLGGAEKAFASLAGALARRGHEVRVFNRCRFAMKIEQAGWETWDGTRPLQTDVLIAFRKPALLGEIRAAAHRVLWLTGQPTWPAKGADAEALALFKPTVVLGGETHLHRWTGAPGLRLRVAAPAARNDYRGAAPATPASPPRAVVTTHPLHGLDAVLRLWVDRIRPAAPTAELAIYSMGLAKGLEGKEVAPALRPLLAQVEAAADHGVMVEKPKGDAAMAAIYRAARVHLYPGHADDMACFTLVDSQAAGLPAVVRPLGAARERIIDGQTGFCVPDDDAFANVAVRLLTDDATHAGLAAEARARQRARSWEDVAADFDALWR